MSVRWVDRLRRSLATTEVEVGRASWRYLADLGTGAKDLSVGGRRLTAVPSAVSFLLGVDELHVRWHQGGRSCDLALARVSGARPAIPEPASVELRRIHMCVSTPGGASGEEILFPLEVPPDEQADYHELIELIEDNAMPIAGICARPRVNLRVEERAEALRRARRMTLRTAPHLARHAEDWEGQSLRMPYPRRLLTALPEDEWSTYENRMVRTVVRDAHYELVRREREVRITLRQLNEALRVSENWQDNLRRGDWPRTNRIYGLLDANVGVDALKRRIEDLQRQADRLRHAVGVLGAARSSPLFRMLGAVRDERDLRPTNLLLHDTAYHAALVVRQSLNRLMGAQAERAVEDPLPLYSHWVGRALARALAQSGFQEGGDGRWRRHEWEITLATVADIWTFEVTFHRSRQQLAGDRTAAGPLAPNPARHTRRGPPKGTPPASSVPSALLVVLPVWLDLSDKAHREHVLAEVASVGDGRRYVVAFPGDGSSGTTSEAACRDGQSPHLAIGVSPARIDSVEVLAREIMRETWFRDLAARSWPSWCVACDNPHVDVVGRNKFDCETCGTEAAITQETCTSCGTTFATPYMLRNVDQATEGDVSRSDLLDAGAQPLCPACRSTAAART